MKKSILIVVALLLALPVGAKKLKVPVRIVEQRESGQEFVISYPGYQSANCTGSAYGSQTYAVGQANCYGMSMPGGQRNYTVRGYALTLLLPDQRMVVVTCEKKTNWTEWSMNWYRSCRHPTTTTLDAEFNGDKAKLEWSVSLDGSKKQSETYKIVAILEPVSKAQ
ncbi:MAG TPA: hypothetical protein VHM88_14130 [Candidatus Acidoferrales bacterium]|jgi:hypothetical protein|nr:hypothetical protein [Candidatus Acidoferrales bacterium]